MTRMRAQIVMEEPDSKNGGEATRQRDARPARHVLHCEHEATEFLGSGGSLVFRRCTECGDVLVSQAGRTFALPSA
ncbi:MAG: hypothetical protein ACE5JE_08585 [Thermoplasmata archaeon]